MKWEEFLNKSIVDDLYGQVKTGIECPKCGGKIYYDSTVVLTSYPPQFAYWCSCGWSGNAYERWNENDRSD